MKLIMAIIHDEDVGRLITAMNKEGFQVTKLASTGGFLRVGNSTMLMGASTPRILFVHILPNIWTVLLSAITIGFNNAVLAEAAMSYLGIGVSPDEASLGYMLSDSQSYLATTPWYALGAGLVIVLLILGVGLIGEGLQRKDKDM